MNQLVQISNHFKSSARVTESRFQTQEFLRHFIAHGTVLKTINSLGAEVRGTQQRTFTITGPYGSGKSTLALYLSCLLSGDSAVRSEAMQILSADSHVQTNFVENFTYKSGWLVVKHLCTLSPPAQSIATSVLDSLGESTEHINLLSEDECLVALKSAFEKAANTYDGVLVIIDEMGKALDFLSSSNGDLHFFQSFADLVQEQHNVIALGFLHQSFAAYAKGRDTRTQNEWGKVQGRYKDFSFNPSIEESLYLIGESFEVDNLLRERLKSNANSTLNVVLNYFPVTNLSALENALPLDPIVGLLLGPISKRSFSQNERSLFSFIATHERHGFRDYIAQQTANGHKYDILYRIDRLWDYLYDNLGHIIAASGDSKTWLEACDSVDRSQLYGTDEQVFITKLIALLSMIGRSNQLYASKQFLADYLASLPEWNFDQDSVFEALSDLESKSIIIYRHNLNSYHIFRASDLDINRLILDWIDRVKDGVDWVSSCQSEKLILANAHYHRSGVMRWAETQVVSSSEQVFLPSAKTGASFVNFVLPISMELFKELKTKLGNYPNLVIGEPSRIDELKLATVELIALEKIAKEESEKLSRDPIANTEIESREKLAHRRISTTLEQIFAQTQWWYQNSPLKGKSLTAKVSFVADQVYPACPAVQNELVNRMKLSGTSNSALNKLMLAMLFVDNDPWLGLPEDTFPPEKGIYLSCLKAKGWHTPNLSKTFGGRWFDLQEGTELEVNETDSYRLWRAGYEFIKNSQELVVVQDLYDFWMSPPYGLTLGLCKLYTMALLKSLESHLAFYDFDSTKDWIYIPELDEELVAKFIRHPSEAGVRYYELDDTDVMLVKEIALATAGDDEASILATARALVRQLHTLPSWVKRTSGKNLFSGDQQNHFDRLTKQFRDKVLSAKDPFKLILEDIPNLLGKGEDLQASLKRCLSNLLEIDSIVSNHFKNTVIDMLNAEPGNSLSVRCEKVAKSASRPDIENFAKRIQVWSDTQSQEALEALISLVIGVRKEKWTDERISQGYDKVRELCVQFKRYETFTLSSNKSTVGTRPVSLIYQNEHGEVQELEEFIVSGSKSKAAYEEIESVLSKYPNPERVQLLVDLLSKEMKPVCYEAD